jgi:hypothetical protein
LAVTAHLLEDTMETVDPREEEQRLFEKHGEDLMRWVPLLVPMFALLLVMLVYLIGAEVL